jgi:hypothetical protein
MTDEALLDRLNAIEVRFNAPLSLPLLQDGQTARISC